MEKLGFRLVHHANHAEALKWSTSMFNIGDICVIHIGGLKVTDRHPGGRSGHAEMWDGQHWRSDCIQTKHGPGGLTCYPNGSGRDGDYSYCIYRHPDFQESGSNVASSSDGGVTGSLSKDEKKKRGFYVNVTFSKSQKTNPVLKVFDKNGALQKEYPACTGYTSGCTGAAAKNQTPCGDLKIQNIESRKGTETHKYTWNKTENAKGVFGTKFCRLTGKTSNGTNIDGRGFGIHGWGASRRNYSYDSAGCIRIVDIEGFVASYAYVGMPVNVRMID